MTEKEKTPLELSEEIIKMLEIFINGHGICISIASAYSNAKKLHTSLKLNQKKIDEIEVIADTFVELEPYTFTEAFENYPTYPQKEVDALALRLRSALNANQEKVNP